MTDAAPASPHGGAAATSVVVEDCRAGCRSGRSWSPRARARSPSHTQCTAAWLLRRLRLLTHGLPALCQLVLLTREFIPDRTVGRRGCQTRSIAQRSKHE